MRFAFAAVLAIVITSQAATAQTDWRMTLGVLYALSYSINACGIKATPDQLRRLERHISHAEGKVRMTWGELQDIRRKGEIEARKDTARMCNTMGRDAPRLLQELPNELAD